jgi:hypothetical protein
VAEYIEMSIASATIMALILTVLIYNYYNKIDIKIKNLLQQNIYILFSFQDVIGDGTHLGNSQNCIWLMAPSRRASSWKKKQKPLKKIH